MHMSDRVAVGLAEKVHHPSPYLSSLSCFSLTLTPPHAHAPTPSRPHALTPSRPHTLTPAHFQFHNHVDGTSGLNFPPFAHERSRTCSELPSDKQSDCISNMTRYGTDMGWCYPGSGYCTEDPVRQDQGQGQGQGQGWSLSLGWGQGWGQG